MFSSDYTLDPETMRHAVYYVPLRSPYAYESLSSNNPFLYHIMTSHRAALCSICGELRPLPSHLYELSRVCEILSNKVEYTHHEETRLVTTEAIGVWLRLAAELEEVKINRWRFEPASEIVCEPTVEMINSNSEHYSVYATAITRFTYVCNALEEAYRFVASYYTSAAAEQIKGNKNREKEASLKAAIMVGEIASGLWPKHFFHKAKGYQKIFEEYLEFRKVNLRGVIVDEENPSYALHLVRNLRNQIAHGVFPIFPDPEYDYFSSEGFGFKHAVIMLNNSCRMIAFYIQIMLRRFNKGFLSDEYQMWDPCNGPEFAWAIGNCNLDYIANLHLKQKFSTAEMFDYLNRPWEKSSK